MSKSDESLRVAVMAYTPEEAPSTGHTQWIDMMERLVNTDVEVESAYSTVDYGDFEGIVEQINDLQPELPDGFFECPDEEVSDDE